MVAGPPRGGTDVSGPDQPRIIRARLAHEGETARRAGTGALDRDAIWLALYPDVQRMIRITLRLGPPAALSPDDEDLLFEATYRALDSVCRYRTGFRGNTEREAYGWLWTVCRNAARRQAGKHRARRDRQVACDADLLEALADRDAVAGADPSLTPAEARAVLDRAVPNPEWRRLWSLRHRAGAPLDCREIAQVTGRTPGSVAVTLSRIRNAIRRELAAALG